MIEERRLGTNAMSAWYGRNPCIGLQAVQNQDIPMIMGTVLFASLLIVAANLVIDLLYPLLDPRITYS